jgi:hypothetical protein
VSAETVTRAGRLAAEALMVDACTITTAGGVPVFNEATGKYDTPAATTVYSGKCRVHVPNLIERRADAGNRPWTMQEALVMLPVDGSEGVLVGQTVTITAATLDAGLVGKTYTVMAAHHETHATARRTRCKEVTG